MAVQRLFSCQVQQAALMSPQNGLIKTLIKESYKIRSIDQQGQLWSKTNYPWGFTSYGSMSQLHLMSPHFQILKSKLDVKVRQYLRSLRYDVNPKSIQLSTLWVNIMGTGAIHSSHIHPLSVISGTFYLQIPKGTSGIKFEDPKLPQLMACPPLRAKCPNDYKRHVELSPKVGHVILFESYLRHEVPSNQSKSDRVSVSFNYDWV